MRPVYRVRQFLAALRRPDSAALGDAMERYLSTEEAALFARSAPYDQRHALEVLQRLRDAGHVEPELMKAALLHDVGKAFIRSHLWQRVAHVLIRAVRGGRSSALVGAYARHAGVGAERAREAGSPALTVALIREHHRERTSGAASEFDEMLMALQQADESA